MNGSYVTRDFTLTIEREEIRVDLAYGRRVPDSTWSQLDSHGHQHVFADKKGTVATVEWIVTGTHWEGDEYESWEVESGEYRCRRCRELIEPKWYTSYEPEFFPGLARYTIETPDGGTYFLRGDEVESVSTWTSREEWEEKVRSVISSREPDRRSMV